MKKTIFTILIILFAISLTGCNSTSSDEKYQTLQSEDIFISNEIKEFFPDLSESAIKAGKDLSFRIDYPIDWNAEYDLGGVGLFSVIFYPQEEDKLELSKFIRLDLISYNKDTSNEWLDTREKIAKNTFKDYTEEEFYINPKIKVWKIIGNVNPSQDLIYKEMANAKQGSAMILYDNSKLYQITTFFLEDDINNIEIFNHMVSSFIIK